MTSPIFDFYSVTDLGVPSLTITPNLTLSTEKAPKCGLLATLMRV